MDIARVDGPGGVYCFGKEESLYPVFLDVPPVPSKPPAFGRKEVYRARPVSLHQRVNPIGALEREREKERRGREREMKNGRSLG